MTNSPSRSVMNPALLLAAFLLAAAAGCQSPEAQWSPAAGPLDGSAVPRGERREWWMIHHIQTVNLQRIRKPAGYLEHWVDQRGETQRYWVRDLADRLRGYLLPQFQAFQVVETRDIFGERVTESRPMGNIGLEGGIQRILEIADGSIEVEKMTEHTAPPEAAKSP